MQGRNTARRVLRSDTAPDRQQLDGHLRSAEHVRIDRLEARLDETHDDIRAFGNNINATINNLSSGISTEMAALNRTVAGLVQTMNQLAEGLNRVQQVAEDARRMAQAANAPAPVPSARAPTPNQAPAAATSWTSGSSAARQTPAMGHGGVSGGGANSMATPAARSDASSAGELHLRKMDTKPPVFVGDIDGVKLNTFIFQFESYFTQKGLDLLAHDDRLAQELNQCVQKAALVWYERYMTDVTTTKLWSAIKLELIMEFMEPNFEDKMRNRLLTIRQTGGYSGYVGKFRELYRIVRVDQLTAMNLFVNGLSDMQMKREIQRRQPRDLNDAIQIGFLEWEIREKPPGNNRPTETRSKSKGGRGNTTPYQQPSNQPPAARKSGNGGRQGNNNAKSASNCSFCGRGPHRVEDCWFKHPEKRPSQVNRKVNTMFARMTVAENQADEGNE